MKEFDFDAPITAHRPSRDTKQWDTYRSFHAKNRSFVEFETGELMVRRVPNPDDRMLYERYNIQLVTTTDANCPVMYFDKQCTQPVKKAWVTHKGQQHLAIDHERHVVTALLEGWTRGVHPSLGDHVKNAYAYWSGDKRLPVPLETIKVQTPNPEYKKKMGPILKEVAIAVTAIRRMEIQNEKTPNFWQFEGKYEAKEEWYDSSAEDIVAEIVADKEVVRRVTNSGFEFPRKTEAVDFLYVKPIKEI